MRVLVCGGRDYEDCLAVFNVLDDFHKKESRITWLINGGASGADEFARQWAESNAVPVTVFKPDWKLYGKSAGSKRNGEMLYEGRPDIVLAFPGGAGTRNMMRQAELFGVATRRCGRL
jgi:hypothetical protein